MRLIEQQNIRTSSDDKIQTLDNIKNQYHYLHEFNRFQNITETMIKIHFIRFFIVTILYYYSDVFLTKNQTQSTQPWNSLLYFLAMMIEIIKFIGDCSLRNLLKNEKNKLQQIHTLKLNTQNQINNNSSNINDNRNHINVGNRNNNVNNAYNNNNNNSNNNNNIIINNPNPNGNANAGTTLKGATYQDYLSIYSMTLIFKYKHRNYSSAFSISKYMHVICTFFIFGWMSARELYSDSIFHNIIFLSFITSIYITSFEIDLFMIQTSQGKIGKLFNKKQNNLIIKKQNNLNILSQYDKQDIEKNFKNWRKQYLIIQKIVSIILISALFIDMEISLLTGVIIIVLLTNIIGYYFQNIIIDNCTHCITMLKKQQVNPYFILQKSIKPLQYLYKYFIMQSIYLFILIIIINYSIQRLSILLLCFAFARDIQIKYLKQFIILLSIIILISNQNRKFDKGIKMTLMKIREIKYVKNKYNHHQNNQNKYNSHKDNQNKYNNQEENENNYNHEDNKDKQCSICLRDIQNNQIVNILPCSKQHIFHKDCLLDWIKQKKQCPLCRFSLTEYI